MLGMGTRNRMDGPVSPAPTAPIHFFLLFWVRPSSSCRSFAPAGVRQAFQLPRSPLSAQTSYGCRYRPSLPPQPTLLSSVFAESPRSASNFGSTTTSRSEEGANGIAAMGFRRPLAFEVLGLGCVWGVWALCDPCMSGDTFRVIWRERDFTSVWIWVGRPARMRIGAQWMIVWKTNFEL